MGRRVIYRIPAIPENTFTEAQWSEVKRLEYWYNCEFKWTTGRLSFKRYVVFPNTEDFGDLDMTIWELIERRRRSLAEQQLSDTEIITQLERDRLVIVKWGGYFDDCLASGFTRVADNEWNAYLVCDFLLKASTLMPKVTISVVDEGKFIKTGRVWFRDGMAIVPLTRSLAEIAGDDPVRTGHIFSIVDPDKYDRHPGLKNLIPEFNLLKSQERQKVLRNWNWLGYGDGYDAEGDDLKGLDLNRKVKGIRVVEE